MYPVEISMFGQEKNEKTYNKTIETATQNEIDACKGIVKKEVMFALLLSVADKNCYGGLKSTLAQHMSMGINQYPCTVEKMMNILKTYCIIAKEVIKVKSPLKSNEQQIEVVFAQSTLDKRNATYIVCFNCGKNGHYARHCPSRKGYMNTTVDDKNDGVDNNGVSDKHFFHQTSGGDLSKD